MRKSDDSGVTLKVIAFTQRIVTDPVTGERRDCLDQKWGDFATEIGALAVGLQNQAPQTAAYLLEALSPSLVVLTGGNSPVGFNDNATAERDAFEHALIEVCSKNHVPLLGICRGMQIINIHFGGTLCPINQHIATRHKVYTSSKETRNVNSYHAWGISVSDLAPSLLSEAVDADGYIEAFRHNSSRIAGIMWHPEREVPFVRADIDWMKGWLHCAP